MTQRIDPLDARLLRRIAAMVVIWAASALLSTAPAFSTPMRCSGEEKISACKKSLNRSSISLPDQLRAAPVGVHEIWLLEQRPRKDIAGFSSNRTALLPLALGLYEFLIPPRVQSKRTVTNPQIPDPWPTKTVSQVLCSSTARSRTATDTSAGQPCCVTSPLSFSSARMDIPRTRSV